MRNFLWNLSFDSTISYFILIGSIYFKLKLEVCKFIPLTNSVNFRFVKMLDFIINNENLKFDFWSVFTILNLKFEWNWNTLVDYSLQVWFCTAIFHTFRLIQVFLLFSNKLKVGISKTPNLKPCMPKPQLICIQSCLCFCRLEDMKIFFYFITIMIYL